MKMILLIIVSLKTALRSARPLECKAAVLQDDDPPWNGTPAAAPGTCR
jgi:hypothetical protein